MMSQLPVAPQILANDETAELPPGFVPLRLVLQPGGLKLVLDRPTMIVGRHSGCDVRLPLPDVSRRHCRLRFDAGSWWLEDLDSMNGVFVNDERVLRRRLEVDDRMRMGGFTFLVAPVEIEGRSVLRAIAEAIPQRRAS